MSKGLFHYKVLCQKFTLITTGVIALVLLSSALSSIYYLSRWKEAFRADSAKAVGAAETRLQNDISLIDTQMSRIYDSSELMSDLRALLNSRSQGEYFERRLLNSTGSHNRIRSFPEELGNFLLRNNTLIRHVTVNGEDTCNWVGMDGRRLLTGFNICGEEPPAPDFSGCIEIQYTVYDPEFNFAPIGILGFWFDLPAMLSSGFPHNTGWFVFSDADERLLYISDGSGANREITNDVKRLEKSEETLPGTPFNRLYVVGNSFLQSQYRVYTCVGESALAWENAGAIVFTFAVFILLGIAFVFFSYYNLNDDARFLDGILGTIGAVKRGDFSAAKENICARNNEYGMIASELNEMSRELQEHIIAEMQLKIKQQDAEMRVLQHQINPHFLYNTLEVIRAHSLAENDSGASDAIANLGAIYRSVIKSEGGSTIGSELELLKKYLKLMLYRYPNNFFSQTAVDKELLSVPTVKFWMQPIAENFFFHGFNNDIEYNLFVVSGQQKKNGYLLEFVDNGATLSEEKLTQLNTSLLHDDGKPGTSIGLSNVYARLRYFYGERFTMKVENNPESGVRIVVYIPEKEGGTDGVYPVDRG